MKKITIELASSKDEQRRQNCSSTLIVWWFVWLQWPNIYITRSKKFRVEDMCMFLHFGLKRQKTVFRFHCHVDVIMWWYTNINMTVLFTTMNITYKYSTQKIVESVISVCYWALVYWKKNVFDSTDAVKPSAWSIKKNKDDGFFNWHTTKI